MCLTPTEPALAGRLVSAPNGSSRQIGQRLWNTITRTSAPTAALSTVRVLGPVALNAKSNADLVLFGVNWRPSGGFGY